MNALRKYIDDFEAATKQKGRQKENHLSKDSRIKEIESMGITKLIIAVQVEGFD